MKKVNLLALAALTSVGSVFAEEYKIITDGVLNSDYSLMESVNSLETVAGPDGEMTAKLSHVQEYAHIGIDMTNAPVDLTKAWFLEMEYAVGDFAKEEAEANLFSLKKPYFIIGATNADIEAGDAITVNKADAIVYFDGKMADGQETEANTYYKASRFMYKAPSVTSVNALAISFCWEMTPDDGSYVAYIKNLRIYSPDDCTRPFYAENFDGVNGSIVVYNDNTNAGKIKAEKMNGGYQVASDEDLITFARSWQEGGLADASQIWLDDELYHALEVKGAQKITISGVALPDGASTIYTSMLAKYFWEEGKDAFYDEPQPMSAALVFNDGTSANLSAEGVIPEYWTNIKNEISVPAGATSFDIVFDNVNGKYGYLIDELQLSTCSQVDVEEAAADAKASIVVTPNPATEVITVAGAEKIEVIALNGSVVASANGEQANVAALAAGAYIVKATTAEGVAYATIIKK